ncbi:hypothetical protein PVL29_026011 [Vitis rotundifolia]|uniref:Uncharacterized protein n=1 Tax=Vitis rotundifolia TaxID=103349 RepID=A0AA38YLJ8_VITRO|nr:hypothetical protein PVL29_026011 [Vitis rotundifolia]
MQWVPMRNMITDFIGRGIAKVHVEMEREAQIDSKNFEIVCWHEERAKKKESRDVFGGSFAAIITVGTAALAVLSLNLIGAKHL